MKSTSTSMSMEKMMSRMFRRVDSVVWDLMTGRLGVRTRDGEIATIEGSGEDASISLNPFEDFGIAIPAFAQSTPSEAVKVGDLIYTNGSLPAWIIEIRNKTPKDGNSVSDKKVFRTLRADGTISSWIPPKVEMFGLDGGVLVVRSLMTMLPGGNTGLASFQGMLMPMLVMGGDNIDLEKMLPMMLMMQLGTGTGTDSGTNPMGNMMQTMMMMKMMGGNDLFGFGGTNNNSNKLGGGFR